MGRISGLRLTCLQIDWGFMGNEYARFATFLCNPVQSAGYIKDVVSLKAKRYLGHNPAGAAMIILLLLSLLLTYFTGVSVYGADQGAGPLAGIGSANEKALGRNT
jgi:cytochrome b